MRRHNLPTLLSLGMLRGRVLNACFTAFIMLLSPVTCQPKKNYDCHHSCGNIQNISYPFRLKGDPQYCGDPRYELSCENNRTILQIDSGRYYVEEINYNYSSMRVVDTGLQKDNCSSLPIFSLTTSNFIGSRYYDLDYEKNAAITFISCETPVNSSSYIDTSVCKSEKSSLKSSSSLLLDSCSLADLVDSCSLNLIAWASYDVLMNFTVPFHYIHDALVYGFHLGWEDYVYVYHLWWDYYPQCYKGFFRGPFHVKDPFQCLWNLLLEPAHIIGSWVLRYDSYDSALNITMSSIEGRYFPSNLEEGSRLRDTGPNDWSEGLQGLASTQFTLLRTWGSTSCCSKNFMLASMCPRNFSV